MIVNALHSNMLTSPSRTISGKVELYIGSTLDTTFLGTDNLASFTVNRACDTKFFGFGICQELELHLIDKKRTCVICKDNILKTYLGVDDVENNGISYLSTTPKFYVTDVIRDENTNSLTVKASDLIYKARLHTISEITITAPYTIRQLATAIAQFFGLSISIVNVSDNCFDTSYEKGGNFGGDELIRAILDDIAEATQTIYYIDSSDKLVFKRLDVNGAAVTTIDKSNYFKLTSKEALTLTSICHATELGDNLTATTGAQGITQYVRDNTLWNLRTDLDTLLNNAIAAVGGLSIEPFTCDWRSNYLIELGDKVNFVAKDDVVTTYLLNDKYTYNGGLSGTSSWEMPPPQEETATNPTNLGDKINQTFARVDKIEKNITLYVGEVVKEQIENTIGDSLVKVEERVSQLELTTEGINAEVTSVKTSDGVQNERLGNLEITANDVTTRVGTIETKTDNSIEDLNNRVSSIAQETALKVDAKGVEIIVEESLTKGVEKVVTSSKKYSLDDNGLDISSNSSNINTTITEDGMRIYRAGDEVLVANNDGVKAEDLHATTYLIIGETSRLEDRANRTACFWIGGN